jgi:hypothetical protein
MDLIDRFADVAAWCCPSRENTLTAGGRREGLIRFSFEPSHRTLIVDPGPSMIIIWHDETARTRPTPRKARRYQIDLLIERLRRRLNPDERRPSSKGPSRWRVSGPKSEPGRHVGRVAGSHPEARWSKNWQPGASCPGPVSVFDKVGRWPSGHSGTPAGQASWYRGRCPPVELNTVQ